MTRRGPPGSATISPGDSRRVSTSAVPTRTSATGWSGSAGTSVIADDGISKVTTTEVGVMKMKVMIPALAALALAGQAMAEDFNYNYVDGAIVIADAGRNDGKGLSVSGSTDMKGLYENAIGFG